MKPISLQMSYFGPFEDEHIDFSKVQDQMFLISGKTGSGKTMIFDAITFALYGEASTSDRNEQSVRSQFATDDDISRIVLSFSIRDHTYTVERELTYQKEGNKSKVPNKAVLYDEDGAVLSSQVRGVTEKVNEIIKLSVNQFRQILILPQGEFKRLLLSKSEEKQSILRTLFQTGRFVQFEESLKSEGKEHQKSLDLVDSHINGLFQSVITDEALEEAPGMREKLSSINRLVESAKEEKEVLTKKSDEALEKVVQLEKELKEQEEHNKKLAELRQIEEKMAVLHSKKEKIETLEAELHQYQIASKIEFELKKEVDIADESKVKEKQQSELEQHNLQINEDIKHKEGVFQTLKNKQEEMRKREKWLTQNERFLDEKYKDLYEKADRGSAYIKDLENSVTEHQETIKKYNDEISHLKVTQEDVDQHKEALFKLEKNLSHVQEDINREEEYIEADKRIETLNNKVKHLKASLKKSETEYEELEHTLKGKYLNEDKVHIDHLLEHLKVGAACPVCQQTIEEIPEETSYLSQDEAEEIETLKQSCKNIRSEIELNERDLYAERKNIEDKERINLQNRKEVYEKLKAEIKTNSDMLESKKTALQALNSKKENVYQLEQALHSSELKLQSYRTRLNEVLNMKKDFTGETEYEDYNQFVTAFYEEREAVEDYFETFESVKIEIDKLKSESVKIEERLKLNKERLIELEALYNQYKGLVDIFLNEHGFQSREALRTILQLEHHTTIEKEIQTYYEEQRLCESQAEQLKGQLKSLKMYDLDEIEAKLSHTKEMQETLAEKRATIQNTIQHNENIFNKMKQQIDKFKKEQKNLNALLELANIVSGKNHAKVSLERYVLTYYLERILAIANQRLLEMTNHRYALVRSTSKMSRQTGLDIEVFDYYNNNKRHITSLSGGETFQASLTLALALNEALQQESGGISLDTMLIDEGFGTLDVETLDTAINTLIDLQSSGKTIGVISHVAELKERMENILYVTATDEKSSTHFNT